MEETVAAFTDCHIVARYHERIDDVTPADAYRGDREEIVGFRKEVSRRTLPRRSDKLGAAGSERRAAVSIGGWPDVPQETLTAYTQGRTQPTVGGVGVTLFATRFSWARI